MDEFFKSWFRENPDPDGLPIPYKSKKEFDKRWKADKENKFNIRTEFFDCTVSTVFLQIDHDGLMYETMIFGGLLDGHMNRTRTRNLAYQQHDLMCLLVRCEYFSLKGIFYLLKKAFS